MALPKKHAHGHRTSCLRIWNLRALNSNRKCTGYGLYGTGYGPYGIPLVEVIILYGYGRVSLVDDQEMLQKPRFNAPSSS